MEGLLARNGGQRSTQYPEVRIVNIVFDYKDLFKQTNKQTPNITGIEKLLLCAF